MRSHVEANGHDEVYEVAGVWGFDQTRTQWADELEDELIGVDALEAVAEELWVEADLERLSVKGHGDRLARLPDIGGLSGDGQGALTEAQTQGGVLLGKEADATHDIGELCASESQFVLDGLGEQLSVVRELAIDQ